ncbi:hypothetical protein AMK19_30410, partial [Kitasatospora sp. CB01950]
MTPMGELGTFLKSRRARLHPADAGLGHYGRRRRVPGLRREELAQLAGVSVSYYARLEQGLGQNVSDTVLDALARALRLTDAETTHLHTLARPHRTPTTPTDPAPVPVPPGIQRLITMTNDIPLIALGPATDVLAWNPLAHTVFAPRPPHPHHRPNMTRTLFTDPPARTLYTNWHAKTHSVVAHLRMTTAQHPH